jgi:hypothetical protein
LHYYEVRLQTSCDTSETGFSETQTIRTKGCGNCIDLNYCENTSDDASGEYIDSLIIGPLVNHSGNNGGYMLFDAIDAQFIAGDSYPVWISPDLALATLMNKSEFGWTSTRMVLLIPLNY